MLNKNLAKIIIAILLIAPNAAFALEIPKDGNDLAEMTGINAEAYLVTDAKTGEVLISKNADLLWTPASLTKLLTVLVVLDSKVNLNKQVAMTSADQTAGWCGRGGVCIKSKAGVKFTVDGLIHATLILSANNAANALSRSLGLSKAEFARRMNEKAASLGAVNSNFYEPTGLDAGSKTTAQDFAKILTGTFSNSYLRNIASLQNYLLRSSNNSRYNQTIKNANKLVSDLDVRIFGAKTGYLHESKYNFSALISYHGSRELAVVVLGADHLYTALAETKILAKLGLETKYLASLFDKSAVLGSSIP